MTELVDRRNTSAYWALQRLAKYARNGVVRAVHPRSTIRRASRLLETAGITRVADVTGLDRLGIPNFMSVRPRDLEPGISYYNGKGSTRSDAHAGAIMEAIERHAGESCTYLPISGSRRRLQQRHRCVDVDDLIVPKMFPYSPDLDIEWVAGFDLMSRTEVLVPLNSVICPYDGTRGPVLFYASSNGLASGNSLTEALCHALCEVVERDAQAMSMAPVQIGAAARDLLGRSPSSAQARPPQISLASLPRRAKPLLSKIQRAGLEVWLRDLTLRHGIATIDCTIVNDGSGGFGAAHGGCGAHPDARVALLRALTEAAQSRLTCIQGGREDLPLIMKGKTFEARDPIDRFDAPAIDFERLPSIENDFIDDDITDILASLQACGLGRVIVFDMTHPEVGIPVVRVVIPKAETWTVFHLHTGRGRFGSRVASRL